MDILSEHSLGSESDDSHDDYQNETYDESLSQRCDDSQFDEDTSLRYDSSQQFHDVPQTYDSSQYNDYDQTYGEGFERYDENPYYDNTFENYNQCPSTVVKSCIPCEREFYNTFAYDKHMSEHRICGIDGCAFTAHTKIVDCHIEMQHKTGLYDKIRNLSTPDDIKKWIEDRKRKYPSKANIEIRYKIQEEKAKRGERLEKSKSRFKDEDKTFKLQKNKQKRKRKDRKQSTLAKPTKVLSLIDTKSDWNGEMFPFRGTATICSSETADFNDSEWNEEKIALVPKPNQKIVLNNSLGALMGAYNSSEESDDDCISEVTTQNILQTDKTSIVVETVKANIVELSKDEVNPTESSCTISTDKEVGLKIDEGEILSDGEVVEEKISKQPIDVRPTEQDQEIKPSTSNISNRKRSKRGRRNKDVKKPKLDTESAKAPSFRPATFQKRRPTLLEKLLKNEIRRERNVLLQCVRYIVRHDFFDKKIELNKNE